MRSAQHGCHILIRSGNTGVDIHYHNDTVCQFNANLRLTPHEFQHIILSIGLNTAGIHQREGSSAPLAVAVDPVTGHAGGILNDGDSPAGELIKQHGLAHIGTTNNGHQRLCHGNHSFPFKQTLMVLCHNDTRKSRKTCNCVQLTVENRQFAHCHLSICNCRQTEKEEG